MKKILLSIACLFLFSHAFSQNPIIGTLSKTRLNFGTGINSIIVPVNWVNTASGVTFTGVSSNSALFSVTGITYNAQSSIAVIYGLVPKTTSGTLNLSLSASNGNGTSNTTVGISVGEFYQRGVLYSVYDIVFWQRSFPAASTPAALTTVLSQFLAPGNNSFYCPIGLTVGPSLNPGQCQSCNEGNFSCFQKSDGMTIGFTAYLTPTVSGVYTFTGSSQDNFDVFIGDRKTVNNITYVPLYNNDTTSNMLFTSNKILNSGPTGTPNVGSYITTLTGGIKYAIRAAAWPVFTKNLNVQWSGPGFSTRYINSTDALPYYDLAAPTVPSGLTIKNKGTNFINLTWSPTKDNQKLVGYYIYLNGLKYTSVSGLTFNFTGLGTNTNYSIAITAFDLVGNESNPSNILNTSTYPSDITPPGPPLVFTNTNLGDVSAWISWSGATDVGSEVIGYNVSILGSTGTLINSYLNIPDPNYVFKVLSPSTTYKIKIQSVDGAFNLSPPSSEYTFTTLVFNPLITAAGIRKASVSFFPKAVGRNEGFGINHPYGDATLNYTGPNSPGSNINSLIGLNPSLLRWGTLGSNDKSYVSSSGTGPTVSIADFLWTASKMGGYASYSLGIAGSTDWVSDPQTTATRFMEYIAGPISTNGGARRNSEGYTTPLINNLKGLIIELGNEAWGGSCNAPRPACPNGVNHNCDICFTNDNPTSLNYQEYGRWCREVARYIKSSPYYAANKDKIKIFYSGRNASPNESYGQNIAVMQGDTGEVDGLAISGYMGGNLNYTPDIPRGESELQYYQNSTEVMWNNIKGLQATMNDTWTQTKRYKPFYMYESNMTRSDYNGKLGQAIIMTDYFLESSRYGSLLPTAFSYSGGEWSMIDPITSRPQPFYSLNSLLSKYTKGNVLDKSVSSLVTLYNGAGTIPQTGLDPVGAHLFYENGNYALVLVSRDFTIDYQVQLNNMNNFLTPQSQSSLWNIQSNNTSFSENLLVTTTLSNINLSDGMIVNVPKYGMIIMTFVGKNLNQSPLPLGYTTYKKINGITIAPISGNPKNLSIPEDITQYEAIVSNTNGAFNTDIKWSWSSSNPAFLQSNFVSLFTVAGKTVLNVQASAGCNASANGTLKVRVSAALDPLIYVEDSIVISGQYDSTTCIPATVISGGTITGPNVLTVNGGNVTFTGITDPATTVGVSITWTSSKDSIATIDGNGVMTPLKAGVVTITGTFNPSGLTASIEVTINPIPSVITTPGTIPGTSTGINSGSSSELNIYPNPATEELNVVYSNQSISSIQIFDLYGKLVSESGASEGNSKLSLSGLASGTYIIQVNTPSGVARKRFMKK
ncbi:MAG: T9SS type A sorting domain-containing protein [Bacteroidota bacterium]|nr:T9SS type A sorting domain-containing protein [Bacteroidota bacterium]